MPEVPTEYYYERGPGPDLAEDPEMNALAYLAEDCARLLKRKWRYVKGMDSEVDDLVNICMETLDDLRITAEAYRYEPEPDTKTNPDGDDDGEGKQ
jgi:hypothetical protein